MDTATTFVPSPLLFLGENKLDTLDTYPDDSSVLVNNFYNPVLETNVLVHVFDTENFSDILSIGVANEQIAEVGNLNSVYQDSIWDYQERTLFLEDPKFTLTPPFFDSVLSQPIEALFDTTKGGYIQTHATYIQETALILMERFLQSREAEAKESRALRKKELKTHKENGKKMDEIIAHIKFQASILTEPRDKEVQVIGGRMLTTPKGECPITPREAMLLTSLMSRGIKSKTGEAISYKPILTKKLHGLFRGNSQSAFKSALALLTRKGRKFFNITTIRDSKDGKKFYRQLVFFRGSKNDSK